MPSTSRQAASDARCATHLAALVLFLMTLVACGARLPGPDARDDAAVAEESEGEEEWGSTESNDPSSGDVDRDTDERNRPPSRDPSPYPAGASEWHIGDEPEEPAEGFTPDEPQLDTAPDEAKPPIPLGDPSDAIAP